MLVVWLFGNPQTSPRKPTAIVAVLEKEKVKILAIERKADHGSSGGTVETTDSQAVEGLEDILLQIKIKKDLVKATEAESAKLSSKIATLAIFLLTGGEQEV